nr:MAG TPA: hypothetical protein [Caudoviricetes sp.]
MCFIASKCKIFKNREISFRITLFSPLAVSYPLKS